MRKLIITFFIFIFGIKCFPQSFYRYPVTNYSTKDYGVFQGQQNWAIVQDREWNIYIGNDNGVLLFNGLEWKFIPVILGQKVNSLALDTKNRLYVGCSGGQFGYLEKNISGKYFFYELSSKLKEEEKPTSNIWRINCLKDDAYFQSNEAIYHLSNNKLSTIKPEASFHLSLFTGDELYARDRGRGLVKISGNKTELVNGDTRLKEYGLFALLKDDSNPGTLILVTQELGVFRINKTNGALTEIQTPDYEFLIKSKIFGAIKLPGNLIALNTQFNGTIIIDNNARILKIINQEIGVMNNYVICQFYDKAGNLWLGLNNGIAKIEINSSLQLLNENSGYNGNINSSGLLEEDIYLGTSTGLFCKKRQDARFTRIDVVGPVWKIKLLNKSLFIAAENGLFRIDNEKPVKILESDCKTLFYSEKLKKYFIGTIDGIYLSDVDFKNPEPLVTDLGELYEIEEGKTEEDSKPFIWATTNNGNTVAIDIDGKDIKIKSFTSESGLPHEWIYPFRHKGKIFFGTNYGLLELKGKSFSEKVIFDYATLSGKKIENSLTFFEPINESEYYYVNNNFVHHYDYKNNIHRKLQMVPETYGRVNDVHFQNKKLLVSCMEGAVVFEEQKSKEISPVILRKIQSGDDSVLLCGGTSTNFNLPEALNYSYNNLHFSFSSGDFSDEKYNFYKIRLIGTDSLNFEWKRGNSISFNNLSEGNYKLFIKYKNIFGQESNEIEVSFKILPPWYRTTLAYFGYFVIFVTALIATAKIASYRLTKQKKILEDLVAKRTAEIAGKL
jgi:ligand-binding sensor domain-containing protein